MNALAIERLPLEGADKETALFSLKTIISYAEFRVGVTSICYHHNTDRSHSHLHVTMNERDIDDLMIKHGLHNGIRLVTPYYIDGSNFNLDSNQVRVNFSNIGTIKGIHDSIAVSLPYPIGIAMHSMDALQEALTNGEPFAAVRKTAMIVHEPTGRGRNDFVYAIRPVEAARLVV